MRKKILFFISSFAFFSLVLFNVYSVYAQEETLQMEEKSTSSASIKYDLAYPGILPDNSLYKLKVIRDKISERLISDPRKKIDFYLLQTDKGILASAILVDKHEIKLAKETALKAENNFTLLTYQLDKLPTLPDNAFFEKLTTASLKHQEVIKKLIERVSSEDQKTFQQVLGFSKTNLETVKKFKENQIFDE